ncbi:uncharacterized protein PFL1_06417 [Pseudozyma flocculosa PF-1]|uniref:threonine--tRNA ligase n=2 Tax=Pseudozyma flocculosa TaxID=84751 RepID=A0A5C3EX37_9BASI|nr:uncharacterized protein PFL1_06417 [Pseudozyma flocculosa PF-1]EPQ25961.1 hypothetical protein PFL1_06417 [Pseudozyma flocculosa PF-1]SPO35739.1 related to MST1 - threonine--tRNA ligase, mitochondrial [Pseudozyma flocculosa]
MATARRAAKATARLLSDAAAPSSLRCVVTPRRCLSNLAHRKPVPVAQLRLVTAAPQATSPPLLRAYSTAGNSSAAAQPSILQLSEADHGRAIAEVFKERLPPNHPKVFLARLQDGSYHSLSTVIPATAETLEALSFDSPDPAARHAFWLSSAYLLGMAVREVLGERVMLAASPTLNAAGAGGAGFAYEYFLRSTSDRNSGESSSATAASAQSAVITLIESQQGHPSLSEAEIKQIEKRLEKLASSNLKLQRDSVSLSEARELFGGNPFKAEKVEVMAARHGSDLKIPIVRIGDSFADLLPSLEVGSDSDLLIPDSKPIKAVKISDWSAATWTPSDPLSSVAPPATQALTRLRAVSFPSPAQLKAHLAAKEAALASDHRTIGKAQALFLTHDSSPGTPFILPHGMRLARKVERVVRDLYDIHGYDEVQSPQLYRSWLWKKSGHWDNYREDMFASEGYKERSDRRSALAAAAAAGSGSIEGRTSCCSIHDPKDKGKSRETATTAAQQGEADEDADSFGLKPMNCPGHCLIFGSQERSYRDLPIRYAEFSPLHRNEASGSLSGLTRVRRFHQDDAHVFCRPDQVSGEIESMLTMLSSAYETFGFQQFELVLSTRPANFIGSVAEWDAAESDLKRALDGSGRQWTLNEADGAFYGPKIDIRLVDAAGRKHQTATIQLDFQLPQRFDLAYTDESGGKSRPVMIHRAILGSVERFLAILIEQTSGWWPFWLSPRQAIVLPASRDEAVVEYAAKVQRVLSLGFDPTPHPAGPKTTRERPLQRFYIDLVSNSNDKLAKLVRSAQLARYNYILVVGEAERQDGTVNVRMRDDANAPAGIKRLKDEQQRQSEGEGEGEGEGAAPSLQGSVRLEDLRQAFCRLDRRQTW